MINPLQMLMQARQRGMTPAQAMSQIAQQNPQLRQAMQLLEGKSQSQQMQMIRNMAAERGIDIEQMAKQMGIPMR